MAKAPVVPVYIQYGRKKIRRHITVSVGKAIPAEKFDVDLKQKTELKAISASIMGEIAALKESTPNAD